MKEKFSFTTSYNRKGFNFLRTRIKLSKADKEVKNNISGDLLIFPESHYIEYCALWDTGASRSLIDKKVVKDLDLESKGTTNVKHFSEKKHAKIYKVNIIIFNTRSKKELIIENLPIAEEENFGADVIIGLDLIVNFFDVAITSTEKIINFSIRHPSMQTIDFEKYSYKQMNKIKE